jgi:hypothetical protein
MLTTPADAYKYFKGESIKHPLGYDVKIDTPLDSAVIASPTERPRCECRATWSAVCSTRASKARAG